MLEAWEKAEKEENLEDGEKHYIRYGDNNENMFIIQAEVNNGNN